MMKKFLSIGCIVVVLYLPPSFQSLAQTRKNPPGAIAHKAKGLKDYYSDYFSIGVAVSPRALKTDEAHLVLQQFNGITPENAMKMGPVHPAENQYNWEG